MTMWRAGTVVGVIGAPAVDSILSTRRVGVALSTALAVVVLDAFAGGFVLVPFLPPVDPAAGLAFGLSLVFGPAAAVGAGLGSGATAAVRSGLTLWLLFDAFTYGVFGYLAFQSWGRLTVEGVHPRLRSRRELAEFGAVTAVAAATTAPLAAWLGLVGWGGSFHGIVLAELPILVVSAAVAGPVVVYPAGALSSDWTAAYADRSRLRLWSGLFLGRVVAPGCWLVSGSLLSAVTVILQRLKPVIEPRGYGWVAAPVDPALVGPAGRRVQLLAGGAFLGLILLAYAPESVAHREATGTVGENAG